MIRSPIIKVPRTRTAGVKAPITHIKKQCITCKFYDTGFCTAYASQDPVSGEIQNFWSDLVRLDTSRCGPDGKWHIKKCSK